MSSYPHNTSKLPAGQDIHQDQVSSAKRISRADSQYDADDVNEDTLQFHTSNEKDITRALEKPFSIFTRPQKWVIVAIASVAGLFSGLTSNIYLPAIPVLTEAFHESTERINLTVTIYLVMQGISPMFWGTLADRWGRRPMFLGCMAFLVGSCIGLGLTPTNAYWLLLFLRCLQAVGAASTIALGAGVISDIATTAERGGFYGLYSIGPMFGPCIGPVIGGGLVQGLGWRSIFWFLTIAAAACFLAILLFLPETLRALVGDGSIRPAPIYRPIIPVLTRSTPGSVSDERPPYKPFQNPLKLFLNPVVDVLLVYNAILYAVFYGVSTSISTIFQETYPFLNDTDTGLCFLSIGGGMLIGGVVNGKMLDREYRILKEKLIRKAKVDRENGVAGALLPEDVTKPDNFPIELARFGKMPYYAAVYVIAVIGYGWCLQAKVSIAGPLILLFLIGISIIAIVNTTQTLIVDLAPSQGGTITACNNLVRCSFAAILVAFMDVILKHLKPGWTYVLLGGICVVVSPLMFIMLHIGPRWRRRIYQQS